MNPLNESPAQQNSRQCRSGMLPAPQKEGQTLRGRSRAVTTEEFERMTAAVPTVRPADAAAGAADRGALAVGIAIG